MVLSAVPRTILRVLVNPFATSRVAALIVSGAATRAEAAGTVDDHLACINRRPAGVVIGAREHEPPVAFFNQGAGTTDGAAQADKIGNGIDRAGTAENDVPVAGDVGFQHEP